MMPLTTTDCAWPEKGKNQKDLTQQILDIPSLYKNEPPPFCYPGTLLSGELRKATSLLIEQFNCIGSHTHIKEILDDRTIIFEAGEGGFKRLQEIEAQVIWMIASTLGGTPETIDGYFCGGGTEANIEGIWIGREFLRQCPDPMKKGIAVLVTSLQHFSITQATEMLDMGHPQWLICTHCGKEHVFMPDPSGNGINLVGMTEKGEMSIAELKRVFQRKYDEGFRKFLIVPTVGTTLMGSIDPINEISKFITKMRHTTGANFYMHVDASFAGFTVPFVNPNRIIGFQTPEVMSMTLDGDKMGRLPYPAGIFLCRKGLMSLVARKVNYVRGHDHDTVSGSRSCLSQVYAWYLYQVGGKNAQRKYVKQCLQYRDKLVSLITPDRFPFIKILPCSPCTNFAPLEIKIQGGKLIKELGEIPEQLKNGILAPYELRSDFLPSNPTDPMSCPRTIYKICIMPHTFPWLEKFLDDLEKAEKEWRKKYPHKIS